MADIFLSYARQDTAAARMIKDRLEGLGLSVFFDTEGLDGGDVFPDVLDREVKTAGAVVGVWSTHALTRPWVKIECDIGRARGVLVPVQIEQIAELDKPAAFWNVQFDDLSDYDGDHSHAGWRKFIRSLSRTLDRPDLLEAAGITPAASGPVPPPRATADHQPAVSPEAVALWNSDMKHTGNIAALERFMGMVGVRDTPLEHRVRERIDDLKTEEAKRTRRRSGARSSASHTNHASGDSAERETAPPVRLPRVAALILVAIATNLAGSIAWRLIASTLFAILAGQGRAITEVATLMTVCGAVNGLVFTTLGAVAGTWLHARRGMAWASALSIGALALVLSAGFFAIGMTAGGQAYTTSSAPTTFGLSALSIAVVTALGALVASLLTRRMVA